MEISLKNPHSKKKVKILYMFLDKTLEKQLI